MNRKKLAIFLLLTVNVLIFTALAASAQQAQMRINVAPDEAYIFVDGKPVGEGIHILQLTPGVHTVSVYNYGFKPQVHEVDLKPGKNEPLTARLEAVGENVTGPWGVIQIEGAPRAAVLLNGKTPEYFVGHGDEFNNHNIWRQQLVVPAGTHQLTVLEKEREIWSGAVEVPANQRVILHLNQGGKQTVVPWPEAAKFTSLPRFKAGTASATVAVAPVTGTFSAEPTQIDCNQPVRLAWNTTETIDTAITSDSETFDKLPMTGERTVSPKHTTTYHFRTAGPGGIVEHEVTVNVNPVVKASLHSTQPEIHYLRIGDKVLTQESSTLNWTVANADNITMEPMGPVAATGNQVVNALPKQTTRGPIDETQSYTLRATNVCGGSETQTTSLHIAGMVEPVLTSVFFPTAYPDKRHPEMGLVQSQQKELIKVAEAFRIYLDHTPEAKLLLMGNADERDTHRANLRLSERRLERVKQFLVAQGVPAEKIQVEARGKTKLLPPDVVKQLEAENPNPVPEKQAKNFPATRLAYNRRVDIVLLPAALESARFYPHNAEDASILWERARQNRQTVEKAQ